MRRVCISRAKSQSPMQASPAALARASIPSGSDCVTSARERARSTGCSRRPLKVSTGAVPLALAKLSGQGPALSVGVPGKPTLRAWFADRSAIGVADRLTMALTESTVSITMVQAFSATGCADSIMHRPAAVPIVPRRVSAGVSSSEMPRPWSSRHDMITCRLGRASVGRMRIENLQSLVWLSSPSRITTA